MSSIVYTNLKDWRKCLPAYGEETLGKIKRERGNFTDFVLLTFQDRSQFRNGLIENHNQVKYEVGHERFETITIKILGDEEKVREDLYKVRFSLTINLH